MNCHEEEKHHLLRNILTISPTTLLLSLVYVDFLAVLLAIGLGFALHQSPTAYTGEGEPITWLSFAHLLVISGIAGSIFYYRTDGRLHAGMWRSPMLIWLLIALGFLFLAVDEVAKIHESLDRSFHRILQMQETGLTDRLDDAIVLAYGVMGLGVLYVYREELMPYRPALPLVVGGFALFIFMGLLDAMVNRNDVFLFLGINEEGEQFLGEVAQWH